MEFFPNQFYLNFNTGVRLGEHDTLKNPDCELEVCADLPKNIPVVERISHSEYDTYTQANDIALLRLERPVVFSNWIKPICLPSGDLLNKTYDGVRMVVAGWGVTEVNI